MAASKNKNVTVLRALSAYHYKWQIVEKHQTTILDPDKTLIVFMLLGHMIAHLFFPALMSWNEACWRKLHLLKILIEQHEVICK